MFRQGSFVKTRFTIERDTAHIISGYESFFDLYSMGSVIGIVVDFEFGQVLSNHEYG